jgi:hypothetical protein
MKKIFLSLLFLIFSIFLFAQESDYSRENNKRYPNENTPAKKWNFGGGAGLNFGTVTYVMISPQLTYSFSDRILFGSSVTYIYNKINYGKLYPGSGLGIYESSVYGGSLFNNILLFKNIFSHIEYEPLNVKYWNYETSNYDRKWVGSFFVGGGFRQFFGEKSFAQFSMLYNLNYQPGITPYSSPWVPRVSLYF